MNYFEEKIKNEYNEDFLNRFKIIRKSSFRINNNVLKDKNSLENFLKDNNIKYENVSFYDGAYIIDNDKENIIKESAFYNEGMVYFQNLSTMIPILINSFKENENVLDMCAAPGGKTTLLSSVMENKISITSLEIKKPRFERLKYNIEMQKSKAFPMNVDARNLDKNFRFDTILLDAPCTGSGTIEENVGSNYITKELEEKVNKAQNSLLKKASELINKNGLILYMTCSLYKEENESIINSFLSNNNNFILKDLSNGISDIKKDKYIELYNYDIDKEYSSYKNNFVKILPNEYYEGFFFTVLEKIK